MMKNIIKKYMLFSEPQKSEKFILKEPTHEASAKVKGGNLQNKGNKATQNNPQTFQNQTNKIQPPPPINFKVNSNMEYIKGRFGFPVNSDVIIREFSVTVKNMSVKAFIVFFDGMIDTKVVNSAVLEPLMLLSNINIVDNSINPSIYIRNHLIPNNQLKECFGFNEIIDMINFGACGIFIDGLNSAFAADVKGFEHRSVDRPNTEQNIRGPQEGFNEVLRINTSLIRRRLKDEDLMVEDIKIGSRSKTPCSLLYIKDIANDSLVGEVRRRLKSINIDYLIDSGQLEQLIEDNSFLPPPQMVVTERPDRVAAMLTEGRVAVIVNGSPMVLVMPITLVELIKTAEDMYIRFPFANFLRFIRLMGLLAALLLPGIYIAITNYHQEMIPTSLLLAIESTREKVPFPSIVEILIMEFSFELIREAGIRIPGIIGPTLGIIGALILGQAAVAANIVSPILIVIVSITGLGSFAIPDYSFGYSIRFLRFYYILFGFLSGFLGITTGLFLHGLWLSNAKSFGVPILTPFGPKANRRGMSTLLKVPLWKEENRPDYLNPKDETKEPNISRKWATTEDKGGGPIEQ